jgi:hypothetical protein
MLNIFSTLKTCSYMFYLFIDCHYLLSNYITIENLWKKKHKRIEINFVLVLIEQFVL